VTSNYEAAVEVRESIMSVAWELASIKGWLETISHDIGNISGSMALLVKALDGLTTQVAYLAEKE
jgi:hypothetical protein